MLETLEQPVTMPRDRDFGRPAPPDNMRRHELQAMSAEQGTSIRRATYELHYEHTARPYRSMVHL